MKAAEWVKEPKSLAGMLAGIPAITMSDVTGVTSELVDMVLARAAEMDSSRPMRERLIDAIRAFVNPASQPYVVSGVNERIEAATVVKSKTEQESGRCREAS